MRARRKHRAGCGDQECWGGVGAYQEKECFRQKKQFKVLRETVLVTSSWEHWRVKNMCVCVLVVQSCWLFATPWTVAHQAPPSMEFSRQEYWSEKKKKKKEYWSGLSFLPPGDLPDPGIKLRSPALQADSCPSEPSGKPKECVEQSNSGRAEETWWAKGPGPIGPGRPPWGHWFVPLHSKQGVFARFPAQRWWHPLTYIFKGLLWLLPWECTSARWSRLRQKQWHFQRCCLSNLGKGWCGSPGVERRVCILNVVFSE